MNAPSIFLGTLIAIACGLVFHLIRGGRTSRLGLYVATAWVAFFVGHMVGLWLKWDFLRLGSLNLFPAILATVLGLISASVLAGPERAPIGRRRRRKRPKK